MIEFQLARFQIDDDEDYWSGFSWQFKGFWVCGQVDVDDEDCWIEMVIRVVGMVIRVWG